MAGLRKIILGYISQSNSITSAARLLFCRGLTSTLFVKGIPFSTTEERLADAFSQFGHVTEAKIIRDNFRNRSKGYGYVTFGTEDEAQKALMDMNEKLLDGRVVFVDNVRPSRHFNNSMSVARGPSQPKANH